MNSWLNPGFADLRWIRTPTYLFKPIIALSADQAERFQEDFECHTLNAVTWLMTQLLGIPRIKAQTKTVECTVGIPEEP